MATSDGASTICGSHSESRSPSRLRGAMDVVGWAADTDGIDRVFDTAESQGDPVGVKTREAADFIIGGAGSAVSGAGSELGRDAIRTYSPFR